MRGAPRIMTCHLRTILQTIGVLLLLLAMLAPLRTTAQHDDLALTSSEPRANAVLATAPHELSLAFSGDVDPKASEIHVITRDGTTLDGTETTWGDDHSATVTLPDELPRGSYLVAWNVTPSGASAPATGFFGFTVGTDQDVAPVTIPNTGFDAPQPLIWMVVVANGAIVLGLTLLIAVWPAWVVIVRTTRGENRFPLQSVAVAATMIAGTGVLGRIATLAWAKGGGSAVDRLLSPLADDTGQLLLLTLALISFHSLALSVLPGAAYGRWAGIAPWVTTLTLTIPLPLLSHAPNEPAGRVPTLTVTWLVFASLAALAAGVITLASVKPTDEATVRGAVGTVIAIALPTLAIGGAYLAWLYIGSLAALERTVYGTGAMVTALATAIFAATTVLALNLSRRTGTTRLLALPAIAGVILAGSVGALLSFDTARAELTRDASQRTVALDLGNDRAQLILAPGNAGVNHFRLEVDRTSLPRQTTAEMTIQLPELELVGSEMVTLSRVSGSAFEYHGTELTIADRWELGIILTEPGRDPSTTSITLDLDRENTAIELPATPWRFTDFAGSAGAALVVTGLAGLAISIAAGKSPLRRESAGLGVAALVFAAILLGQGRLDPILALGGDGEGGAINPDDLAMITRGEEVYQTNCLTCHGPELRGDGPAADGMQPPPADFAEAHTMVHDEATLIYWVRNGKQGTAMPGFGDTLSDQEIRDVLSFIERRQRAFTGERSVPDPPTCTVAPRNEGELNSLTALTIEEGPSGELIPADNPEVGSATVDAISGTVTEMLACVNAGDLPRATAHFSDSALAWAFTAGREPFGAPTILPEDDRIGLVSMGGFTTLTNDRVAVRVSIRDPEGSLEPLVRELDDSEDVQELTIVLIPSGSSWLIDEIRTYRP